MCRRRNASSATSRSRFWWAMTSWPSSTSRPIASGTSCWCRSGRGLPGTRAESAENRSKRRCIASSDFSSRGEPKASGQLPPDPRTLTTNDNTPGETLMIARRTVLAALACVAFATPAFAQTYPSKPIHLIVPYPAGGGTDFFARLVGQKIQELIGQPVVVENKPGAATNLGADFVAKAQPDGYTILL